MAEVADNNLLMKAVNRIEFGNDPNIKFIFPNNGGAVVMAEKHELAKKSEVFEKQFASNDNKITEQISITDISFETFIKLINHIYQKPVIINEENFLEILYASRKYFLEELTFMVITFLDTFLNEKNVADYFESIDKFEIQMINDHVKTICLTSPITVIESLTTSEPHKRILEIILESSHLPCSEYKLYAAIVKMLKHQQGSTVITDEDFRKQLGKLVYLIRFPTMSINDLVLCGESPSLLTSKQIVDFQLWVHKNIFSNSLQFFSCVPRNTQNIKIDYCSNCRGNCFTCKSCRRTF